MDHVEFTMTNYLTKLIEKFRKHVMPKGLWVGNDPKPFLEKMAPLEINEEIAKNSL